MVHRYGFISLQNNLRGRNLRRVSVSKSGLFTLNYYATYPFGAKAYAIYGFLAVLADCYFSTNWGVG